MQGVSGSNPLRSTILRPGFDQKPGRRMVPRRSETEAGGSLKPRDSSSASHPLEKRSQELLHSKESPFNQIEMHYVYILESDSKPDHYYIGSTDDLKCRLTEHNAGKCSHSSKLRPWATKSYFAFR